MTKSELINTLDQQTHLMHSDVELAVSTILEHMSQTLASGERIEVRGFGSFTVSYRGLPGIVAKTPDKEFDKN